MKATAVIALVLVAYLVLLWTAPSQCIDPACGADGGQTGSPLFTF